MYLLINVVQTKFWDYFATKDGRTAKFQRIKTNWMNLRQFLIKISELEQLKDMLIQ